MHKTDLFEIKTKSLSGGKLILSGIASSNRLDREDEAITITPNALKNAWMPFVNQKGARMVVEHFLNVKYQDKVIGRVINLTYSPENYDIDSPEPLDMKIHVICEVTDPEAIRAILSGEFKAFSLGWKPTSEPFKKQRGMVQLHTAIEIDELSICRIPVNPDADNFEYNIVTDDSLVEQYGYADRIGEEVELYSQKAVVKGVGSQGDSKFVEIEYQDEEYKYLKSVYIPEKEYKKAITGNTDESGSALVGEKVFEGKKEKSEGYTDYPESASNNAKKVLDWKKEHGDEVKGMTFVGWKRATQLANRESLSADTVARMYRFKRHKKNSEIAPEYKNEPWKDNGYVAWLGWGGDSGINWAENKYNQIQKERKQKALSNTSEFCGLPIAIEVEDGEKRFDKVLKGVSYGYIPNSVGEDDEEIDIYIKTKSNSSNIFEIKQIDPESGEFDEHKFMLGFNSKEEAKQVYQENMPDGYFGSIRQISMQKLRNYCDLKNKSWAGDFRKFSSSQIDHDEPIEQTQKTFNQTTVDPHNTNVNIMNYNEIKQKAIQQLATSSAKISEDKVTAEVENSVDAEGNEAGGRVKLKALGENYSITFWADGQLDEAVYKTKSVQPDDSDEKKGEDTDNSNSEEQDEEGEVKQKSMDEDEAMKKMEERIMKSIEEKMAEKYSKMFSDMEDMKKKMIDSDEEEDKKEKSESKSDEDGDDSKDDDSQSDDSSSDSDSKEDESKKKAVVDTFARPTTYGWTE